MKSAIPQRSPVGFDTGFQSCAGGQPARDVRGRHELGAVGAEREHLLPAQVVRVGRIRAPHRQPRGRGREQRVRRRRRVPGLRQRRRRPEVVHQHAAVERALHLRPVVLEHLRRGQGVEQPGVVLGQQVLLHRRRRAAVAHRVLQRPVALDHELLGHHRRLGRDHVVAVVGVDVQRRGRDHEAARRAASPAARSSARAGGARSRTRRRTCRRACAPTAARPTTARSASPGPRARPSGRCRGRPSPSPARR